MFYITDRASARTSTDEGGDVRTELRQFKPGDVSLSQEEHSQNVSYKTSATLFDKTHQQVLGVGADINCAREMVSRAHKCR
jgi:hypothetical protein